MDADREWEPVFQQVIIRALCDALGFTNLPHDKEKHSKTVNQARTWFIENGEDFQLMCDLASMDAFKVRTVSLALIHARSTGDHTGVPKFWRHVFRGRRMLNPTNIDRAVAWAEEPA